MARLGYKVAKPMANELNHRRKMNFVFSSRDITLKKCGWSIQDRNMVVEVDSWEISFSLKISELLDGPFGYQKVVQIEVDTIIRLQVLHFRSLRLLVRAEESSREVSMRIL